jgi:hypothetical protein
MVGTYFFVRFAYSAKPKSCCETGVYLLAIEIWKLCVLSMMEFQKGSMVSIDYKLSQDVY